MERLVCLQDFEKEALSVLSQNAGDYYRSGSDDEVTLKRNFESYNRWLIRPRVLTDVSKRNLSKIVQGKPVQIPVGCSPAGFQGLANSEGEVLTAMAARDAGTIFVLSTYATRSIEDIGKACPDGRNWFQLFPNSNKDITIDLVKRAENAGFEAIVVTLDAQRFGNKRIIARDGLFLPPHITLGNFAPYFKRDDAAPDVGNLQISSEGSADDDVDDIAGHVERSLAQDLTWAFIPFLRKHTKLPIILKGILRPEDAALAMNHLDNISGIWVSNHGGRQIDTVINPICVLPDIARVVQGRCEIYIDSGVRKGTDIFKALALGATMAFVGRPQIFGLAVGGQAGVKKVLDILKNELDLTLALSGVPDVNEITKEFVQRDDYVAKL